MSKNILLGFDNIEVEVNNDGYVLISQLSTVDREIQTISFPIFVVDKFIQKIRATVEENKDERDSKSR